MKSASAASVLVSPEEGGAGEATSSSTPATDVPREGRCRCRRSSEPTGASVPPRRPEMPKADGEAKARAAGTRAAAAAAAAERDASLILVDQMRAGEGTRVGGGNYLSGISTGCLKI